MKLILTLLILLLLPLSIHSKQICLAPSGCPIDMDTGICLNCIEVKEELTKKVTVVNVPVHRVKNKKTLKTPSDYYQRGYPTQPETNLLTSNIHHWEKNKVEVKPLVLKRGSIHREFALCRSGCPSSRAATMNYPHNGKLWRHKPSLHKLRQMTRKDWGGDEKLYDLVVREVGQVSR
jgi:hypothetical protein